MPDTQQEYIDDICKEKSQYTNLGRLRDSNPAHLDRKPSLYRLLHHHNHILF